MFILIVELNLLLFFLVLFLGANVFAHHRFVQPHRAHTVSSGGGSLQTLMSFDTSVRSLRGTGSTTSRELGFAILSFRSLLSFWTWQAQGRGEIFVPLKSIPAHGRAFVFRTALGGGLAGGVIAILFPFVLSPSKDSERVSAPASRQRLDSDRSLKHFFRSARHIDAVVVTPFDQQITAF